MKSTNVDDGYILRFDLHDDLMSELQLFIRQHNITGAWLQGLGAAKAVELGYYNLETETYEWHKLTELMEITNLTGNVAWQNDKPIIHMHVTLSDQRLQAIGGHVKDLIVGGTCEIYLRVFEQTLTRKRDDTTKLNLFDL